MATKRAKVKLQTVGGIIANFIGTHHLNDAINLQEALLLLDQAIYELETITEHLSSQIDGQKDTFQTAQPFAELRVVLNGLEQTEGADADYVVLDNTHIRFYRPLKLNENLKVEYVRNN